MSEPVRRVVAILLPKAVVEAGIEQRLDLLQEQFCDEPAESPVYVAMRDLHREMLRLTKADIDEGVLVLYEYEL